jgi:hypothetical protein
MDIRVKIFARGNSCKKISESIVAIILIAFFTNHLLSFVFFAKVYSLIYKNCKKKYGICSKKIPSFCEGIFKIGIDLLLRALGQLPSAQPGLTTLFGMGRGEPRRNRHHKGIDDSGFGDLRL